MKLFHTPTPKILFAIALLAVVQTCFNRSITFAIACQENPAPTEQQQDEPANNAKAITSGEPIGVTFSNPVQTKWKVGVKVIGGSGSAQNMFITIPVPNDWPEQTVSMSGEDMPASTGDVKFREIDSRVKQMVVTLPLVRPREVTIVTMTFLVATSQINPPADPTVFVRPKTNHKEGKAYLGVGPDLNYRDSKLRKQVKELVADKQNIWQEIETIYDWVRDNIEENSEPPNDVGDVFRNRAGCAEDKVRLFVGMCRAHKIPARMVWVEGTQHAEFMLVDQEAKAYWFPCNVSGIREFGSIAEPRIVLQKGDCIRVPEKESRQKFVAEFATCTGKSKPIVQFIRELLPIDE